VLRDFSSRERIVFTKSHNSAQATSMLHFHSKNRQLVAFFNDKSEGSCHTAQLYYSRFNIYSLFLAF